MSKLFGVLFAVAVVPAEAAPPPPAPPVPTPSLVCDVNNGINVDIRINDLPLVRHELAQITPVPNEVIEVPPYYFHPGTNKISIKYVAHLEWHADAKLDIVVKQLSTGKQLARLNPTKFDGCDKGDFDHRCEKTVTFTVEPAARLPTWSWVGGTKIQNTPANEKSLRAALVAFHKELKNMVPRDDNDIPKRPATKVEKDRLRAKFAAGMQDLAKSATLQNVPIVELDELVYLAGNPEAGLDYMRLDNADTKMEVIGDGTQARIWMSRIPLIYFQGGAHDAPAGHRGPFSVGFDVWFRLIDGKWVPSAIWRTDPMVSLR